MSTYQIHVNLSSALRIGLLCMIMIVSIGCNRSNNETQAESASPAPAQTRIAPTRHTPATDPPASANASNPPPKLDQLTDVELLGHPDLAAQCDYSVDALLTCQDETTNPLLVVNVTASNYARWRLPLGDQWAEDVPALSGFETLYLHARRTGNLTPNLYLVERSGERIAVRLATFGLRDGWSDIYIPLAEIRDDTGRRPDFANVTEVQVVFEWADMSGELEIDSLRFQSVWREAVHIAEKSHQLAGDLRIASDFAATAIADNLTAVTQIQFIPTGDMLVSLQNGRVWWYRDANLDGQYDERHLYATGLPEVVGLLYDPIDGAVWLGGRGQLVRTFDGDQNGVADLYDVRIDGLPWGRHQNNALVWNPDPDPFTGEEGTHWIYFGLGSTEDLEVGGPYNATILRFPREGQGQDALDVVSRGNRNPYALVWAAVPVDDTLSWQLFASENGPDFNDAPDEVNQIHWQHHYGFPTHFGTLFDQPADAAPQEIEGWPYSGALYNVTPHASASGLAYANNPAWPAEYRTLYVALFGQVFSEEIVGHTVDRIVLTPTEPTRDPPNSGLTLRGESSVFIEGLDRPLPITADEEGNLVVGDYATGVIYRVTMGH